MARATGAGSFERGGPGSWLGRALRATPLVVFCRTAGCKIGFGAAPDAARAEELGFASAEVVLEDGGLAPSAVVVTGPVPRSAQILVHELVHAEMKAWASYDALPTWFDEGAATFIAGEPRCGGPPPSVAPEVVARLTTKAAWQAHLRSPGETHDTYCAARGAVALWMARFETDELKAEALRSLLTAVARGTPFDVASGALGPPASTTRP